MKPNTDTSSNAGTCRAECTLAVRLALRLIRAYKLLLSPYFRGSCRFLPSCADYAAEAIERHGAMRGGWLAARRLGRCHPLCRSGLDPVPETLERRSPNAASTATS